MRFTAASTGARSARSLLPPRRIPSASTSARLLGGVEHIPYPYAYRCALGHTSETCGGEIIELLEEQIFKRLFAPEEVAAIIVEPIQGEGGFIPAPAFFLQELQRICNKHGIMLILDEVQAGSGAHRKNVGRTIMPALRRTLS